MDIDFFKWLQIINTYGRQIVKDTSHKILGVKLIHTKMSKNASLFFATVFAHLNFKKRRCKILIILKIKSQIN